MFQTLNGRNQVTGVSGAGQWATQVNPDPSGSPLSLTLSTPGSSLTTHMGYSAGLLRSKRYAGSSLADLTINYGIAPGKQQTLTENHNATLTRVSDSAGTLQRLQGRIRTDGPANTDAAVIDRDAAGRVSRLVTVSNQRSAVWDFTYTPDNQLDTQTLPQLGSGYMLNYDYYAVNDTRDGFSPGQMQSFAVQLNALDDLRQSYEYAADSKRLEEISVTSGSTESFTYVYTPGTDLVESLTWGGGLVRKYEYETNTGRLRKVRTSNGGTTLYEVEYLEHYGNDQRKKAVVTRALPAGSGLAGSYELNWVYDGEDELSSASASAGGTSLWQRYYNFDGIGNRTEDGWHTNSAGQLDVAPGYGSIGYDERGNLTAAGTLVCRYDALNRLIEAENGTVKLAFGYDDQDQRLWTRRFARSGGDWTLEKEVRFVYSGGELVAEYEKQGIGSLTLVRSYVWGVDGLVSMKDHVSGSTYLALVDGSGSVVGLATSGGGVAAAYEYDPFGRLVAAEGPAAGVCRVRWQGMYEEPELGLYYARHRYYAPALERWLSRDPIEEAGGANLYAFCRNDPVNYTDRSGLEAEESTSWSLARRGWAVARNSHPLQIVTWPQRLGRWGLQELKEASTDRGWDRMETVSSLGVRTFDTVLGPTDALNPCIRVETIIDRCRNFESLKNEHGYDAEGAALVTVTQATPILRIMPAIQEMMDGRSISGADYGRRLTAVDYVDRSTLIANDVVSAILLRQAAKRGGTARRVPAAKEPGAYVKSNAPAVQRTLPKDKNGVMHPDVDVPHTQLGRSTRSHGAEPQARTWMLDSKGRLVPVKDIDFTDHGYPALHPNPHQHALTPVNPKDPLGGGFKRSKTADPLRND